jgi:hypothetical protein
MPYTIQARMCQFGDCTVHEPHVTSTFQEALLYIKEQMLTIKGRMWDYVLPNYTHFMGGLGPDRYPIEEVTNIPECNALYLIFGSSHSNCESWSFEVWKSE